MTVVGKTTRLKIYWDGGAVASVDVPFGDFHALGHGKVRKINLAFITVLARPELNFNLPNKNVAGFNSYFPMPFADGARVVIENGSEMAIRALYYQIDYQQWDSVPSPLRFHAQYRETKSESYPGSQRRQRELETELVATSGMQPLVRCCRACYDAEERQAAASSSLSASHFEGSSFSPSGPAR